MGNNERRAQLRELLPSREIKLLDQEDKPEEDHTESIEDQPETEPDEIIPEIIP